MRIKFQTEDGQEQVAEAVSIFSIDENGNEVRTANGGLAVSTLAEAHEAPRDLVVPSIITNQGGTTATGTVVEIDSGASAGSKHVGATTEAEALQELVGFEFTSGVKRVLIGVLIQPGTIPEVQRFTYTLNGDLAEDASNLFNETNNVISLPAGYIFEIPSDSDISRVGIIAKSGGATKTTSATAQIFCVGMKVAS